MMEEKKTGKPKKGETQKYGFTIRFMQMTRFIERSDTARTFFCLLRSSSC